jgi:uncharacterized protein
MANAPTKRRSRRWWVIGGIAVAVVIVVFHLAGGWYFAGVLEQDGLLPQGPSRDFGVVATDLEDGLITLAGSDDAITRPGRFGLWWDGGYAQVDRIVATPEDGSVARRVLIPIEGTPPICASEDRDTCEQLDLETVAYDDPTMAGLAVTDVTYQTPIGPMGAWLVEPNGEASSRWAIHLHGWRNDRREAIRTLNTFAEAGMTSLVVEYRNDQGAPADPTGHYRFGRSEWADVGAAVDYALAAGADDVVLVGYSTGAAAILAFLEQSARRDAVAGVVFDSPNIDFGRAVKNNAAHRKLVGPVPLPPTLTAVAMWIADLRFDVGWKAIDYAGDTVDVPGLVFQGSEDGTVPPSVAADFAAANPDTVTLIETGADHVASWNENPDRYEAALAGFLASLG